MGLVALGALLALAARPVTPARGFDLQVSSRARPVRPISPGFLGLALEYRSIPLLAGSSLQSTNPVLVQLIRNLDPSGRPVLRIGGQSTDRTWWPVGGMRKPLGITYDLSPGWMLSARGLAQATNAKLILGVELEANRPRIAAVEGGRLLAGIGRHYIDALEIGNEPELYPLVPWYRTLNGSPIPWYSHLGLPVFSRRPSYSPAAFLSEFSRTLALLPPLPIAGPVTGLLPWLDSFRAYVSRRSRVRIVTTHAYGLNQCVTDPASPQYPTVPNLLAPFASRALIPGIGPYVGLAHRAGASFRIDEMGSISCNGRAGVSNAFASALWVMDALFTIAASGVDGVNLHTYQDSVNGLFDFQHAHGQWSGIVHPLYYGVLMFAQAAPAGARLLQIASSDQTQVRAWATLAPDHRIRVLLINDGLRTAAWARVRLPGRPGAVTVERLQSAGAFATGPVTLGGQSFGAQTPTGVLAAPQVAALAPNAGVYSLRLPAASAALITAGGS